MYKFALPVKDGYEFFFLSELIYFQAKGNYSLAIIENRKAADVFISLKKLESQLAPRGFIRIHHEYLINSYHMIKYNKGVGGIVELSNGKKLEVSRGRKREFLRRIKGKRR